MSLLKLIIYGVMSLSDRAIIGLAISDVLKVTRSVIETPRYTD